jgi:hypothetical protein
MKTYILIGVILVPMFLLTGMAMSVVDNSIVLYLTFDADEGNTVKDISPSHNDGDIKGKPQKVEGKFGSALELNGTTDSIEIPHNASLNMTTAVTMEMWVKLAAGGPDTNQVGIEKGGWEAGEYSIYAHYVPGSKSAMQFFDLPVACGDANSGNLGKNIKDGEWYHLAGIWDGKKIYIYTDGKLDMSAECGNKLNTNGKSLYIGARNGSERFLQGVVDEVRLYNRALSEAEVKKDMETLGSLSVSVPGKLAVCWGTVKKF